MKMKLKRNRNHNLISIKQKLNILQMKANQIESLDYKENKNPN